MRSPHRLSRINEDLKKEISDILKKEVSDPGLGFLTVMQARISRDLSYARIHVSILGDELTQKNTMAALIRAKSYIRTLLARRVRMRIIPELDFRLDTTLDDVYQLEDAFRKIDENKKDPAKEQAALVEEFLELLRKAKKPAVFAHVFPDADTIGSALAIVRLAASFGASASVYCEQALSSHYEFMPGYHEVLWGQSPDSDHDLLVTVDCGSLNRTGSYEEYIENRKVPLINIDHHLSNENFGEYNIVDVKANAAGQIIYNLFVKAGCKIEKDEALLLFLAIITDTGNFRYAGTTPEVMQIAADLAACGIDFAEISYHLYQAHSPAYHLLLSRALSRIETHREGQVAALVVGLDLLQECGVEYTETEGLVEFLISLEGVNLAVIFKEYAPDIIKISFRTKDSLNVSELARELGGGGHRSAAGCLLKMPLLEAHRMTMDKVESWMERSCPVDNKTDL